MKKLIPLIATVPLVVLALTPPWSFHIDCRVNSLLWLWAVLISGFLTFSFLYTRVSAWLKVFIVYAFATCFLSRAPFISFTMYFSVIACAYYYLLCTKIEDFTVVKKSLQSVFLLLCLLVTMQLFGKDSLFNFNAPLSIIGTIGNSQISASYFCIVSAFVVANPLNWIAIVLLLLATKSSGAVLALSLAGAAYSWVKFKRQRLAIAFGAILLAVVFAFMTGDVATFAGKAGRRQVWEKGVELAMKRPIGYGGATWKVLFPYMCGSAIRDQQPGREWNTAHSLPIQILFEYGFPGIIMLTGFVISILRRVKDPLKLAGFALIVGTSLVHFPDRLLNSSLLIVMFLAYLSKEKSRELHSV